MNKINDIDYDRDQYPDGVQDFPTMREEKMLYVDKTAYIYRLARQPKSFFLSRPRRFGKSLLISTLAAYFEGRKELFEGLAIAELEKEWPVHPVIRIDLSQGLFNAVEEARVQLRTQIILNARRLGVQLTMSEEIGMFQELIVQAADAYGKRVVVLIDEYDKPLLETRYELEELHRDMQNLMRGFYGCLKGSSQYLRFVLITGVTKISHVNIFSGLNNLTDLSLQPWCNAICGISESEMQRYFGRDMEVFARINNMGVEEVRRQFKYYYDGYRFAEYGENIYNPYSVMLAFQSMKFSNYWFATGLPNHVVKSISQYDFDFDSLEGSWVGENELTGIATTDANPVGLLYQAGYLTIKDYDEGLYKVGFPNKEVEAGFFDTVLMVQYPNPTGRGFSAANVQMAAMRGEPERLVSLLEQALNDYNYDQHKDIDSEAVLNSLLYGLVHAIGLNVKSEYHIANGRIDMLIETKRYVYIFEFKINRTAAEAMQQINDKAYADKYRHDTRTIYKIALNYSTRKRQIDDSLIE